MDKKKIILTVVLMFAALQPSAQIKHSYQPLTESQKAGIEQDMFTHNVSSFLVNNSFPIGAVNITNVINMVSYNPVEGTRIRVSAETNSKFSKRLAFSAMAAYGTKDRDIKYALGAAYNFAKKPQSVYSFPCSTLSINWEDNTYIPSYPNYDVAYFSFGSWDKFDFAKRKRIMMSFLQEFPNTFAICPYAYWEKIDSYMLYEYEVLTELLNPGYDYTNTAFGAEISFNPSRKGYNLFTIFNSRFYSFPTQIKLNYSYNIQSYITQYNYNKLEASAQHRIIFSPLALDLKVMAGKFFGTSDSYMYFTPNYSLSSVSNMYGFNSFIPSHMHYKQYIQTYTQLNLGGILLDNISFFKKFRPNEFVNFKALITDNDDFYSELGFGIDHIFGFLGLEIIKRIADDNPYNMPEWALKIRCSI